MLTILLIGILVALACACSIDIRTFVVGLLKFGVASVTLLGAAFTGWALYVSYTAT